MEDRYGPRGWTEEPEKNGANRIKGYAKQAHDYTHNVDHEFVKIFALQWKNDSRQLRCSDHCAVFTFF